MKCKRSRSTTYLYLIYVIQVLSTNHPSFKVDAFTVGSTRIGSPCETASSSSWRTTKKALERATQINIPTTNLHKSTTLSPIASFQSIYQSSCSSSSRLLPPLQMRSTAVIDELEEDIQKQKKKRKGSSRSTSTTSTAKRRPTGITSNGMKTKSNYQKVVPSSIKIQPTRKRRNKKDSSSSSSSSSSKATKETTIKMNKRRRRKQGVNGEPTTSTSTLRVSNLLSKEEEISLTHSIRELRKVIRIRDELSVSKTMNNPGMSDTPSYLPNPMYRDQHINTKLPYKIQPTEQEWAQACNISVVQLRRILVKGRGARKKILDGNAGLVTQVAKRYNNALRKSTSQFDNIGCILTVSDLIQEGNLGLMEAAERFESKKGFRFATYAVHWVRSRILRCIADNSRAIRLPAHVHTTLRTIRKVKSTMEQEIGREPTLPELAQRLQMSLSKLQLYTDSSLPVLSLEVPLGNGRSSSKSGSGDVDKRTLMDKIASDSPTPQEDAEFDSLRRDIRAAIDSLGCDLEKNVLLNRFGLDDGNPRTVEETAHKMCISRDRVRRVEARALNKLRHPQRNYMLKEYVENACEGDVYFHDDDVDNNFMSQKGGSNNSNGNRVTHFGGEDVMNQFTPEMIWSV